MIRVFSLAMVSALSFSLPAFADSPSALKERSEAFKTAKSSLEGRIKEFVAQVEACSPPAFGADIVKGFTGPAPDSAWNALQSHEKAVSEKVADAEAKLDATCHMADASSRIKEAETLVAQVKDRLATDAADYEKGQKIALQNEGRVRQILGARLRIGVSLASTQAQQEGCRKALEMLGESGKENGPLREADRELRQKLAGLGDGFEARLSSIKQSGCAVAQKSARFPSFRGASEDRGEYQVADFSEDTGSSSAR